MADELTQFLSRVMSDCIGSPVRIDLSPAGEVPVPTRAELERYDLHWFVDGDETIAAFRINAGRDYQMGDDLAAVARRFAEKAFEDQPLRSQVEQIECMVLCCCCGSDLTSAVAYR